MDGGMITNKGEQEGPRSIKAFCPRCRHRHEFVRAKINHRLHLILSVVTGGIWLISWVALCLRIRLSPWNCEHCGWNAPRTIGTPGNPPPRISTMTSEDAIGMGNRWKI